MLPLAVALAVVMAAGAGGQPVRAGDPREPIEIAEESAIGLSAIRPGVVDRTSINLRASYAVALALRFDARRVTVTTTIALTNTSGGPIDRVELNTVAAVLGAMRITSVSVDGAATTAGVADQTITVPLGGILPDGASTIIRVGYRATLQSGVDGSRWLFARANGIVSMYRWIPWISVAHPFRRPNHGDPFVTPVSPSVRVSIATDRPMAIATSGRRVAIEGLRQTFAATDVRDFNISASPSYRTISTTVGGTRVTIFARTLSTVALRTWAVRALDRLTRLVGPYPYPTFTVAESVGGWAMESPGLIWIPHGTSATRFSFLVTHETAHQWFYGLVGNDQALEPFADEGATEFLTRTVLGAWRASRCPRDTLDRTVYEYRSACYYEVVYIQGANLLNSLRTRMGASAFWTGIRRHVAAQRLGLSGSRALLDALDAATPLDVASLVRSRFPRLY